VISETALFFFFPKGFEKGVLNRLRPLLLGDGRDELEDEGSIAAEGASGWREYLPNWFG